MTFVSAVRSFANKRFDVFLPPTPPGAGDGARALATAHRATVGAAALLLLLGACTPAPRALVRLETTQVADSMLFEVVAVGRARVNAVAPPALVLEGERVVRFNGAIDPGAPDYFVGPSRASIPAASRVRHGTLHASVCPEGERVCRVVSLPVRLAASR